MLFLNYIREVIKTNFMDYLDTIFLLLKTLLRNSSS